MRRTEMAAWLIGAALLGLAGTAAPAATPTPREVLGGELIVKDTLDKQELPVGRITYVAMEPLAREFPDYLFYVVQYPPAAAAGLPAPLKPRNLFAVAPDGRATLLADPRDWVRLFSLAFRPAAGAERDRVAVRAALLLLQAEHPEYTFTFPEDEVRVTTDPDGVRRVVGRVVARDDRGTIRVTVKLDPRGGFRDIEEVVDLKTAPAPVVVADAEVAAALRAVRAQLVESKRPVEGVEYVSDPLVREAVPGYLFFVAPRGDRDDPKAGTTRTVIVVGRDGKPVELFVEPGSFIRWFNSVYGPATDDARLRGALRLVLRVLVARYPDVRFGTPEEPRLTTEDGDQRVVLGRIPETGPAGRKGILEISLRFGKRGNLVAWYYRFKSEG
jgi:hypothetical protein